MKTLLVGTLIFCLLGQFPEQVVEIVGGVRASDGEPFLAGIVEANGNLWPVASFKGSSWVPILTRDLLGRPMKWTLWYEIQPPSVWPLNWMWIRYLTPAKIEFSSTGLCGEVMYCESQQGVSTDIGDRRASLIKCDNCCPEPKMGIATTGKSPPTLVDKLDPESEEVRRISAQILDTFNEFENKAFEQPHRKYDEKTQEVFDTGITLAEHLESRLSAEKRNRLPLRFDKAFRIQGINATFYYIEVTRSYEDQPREEEGWAATGFLQGWVIATADELVRMTLKFALPGPDWKGEEFNTPIVFWTLGEDIAVLVERTDWDGEDYLIIELTPDGICEKVEDGG